MMLGKKFKTRAGASKRAAFETQYARSPYGLNRPTWRYRVITVGDVYRVERVIDDSRPTQFTCASHA